LTQIGAIVSAAAEVGISPRVVVTFGLQSALTLSVDLVGGGGVAVWLVIYMLSAGEESFSRRAQHSVDDSVARFKHLLF
jgi:hypothetical protein